MELDSSDRHIDTHSLEATEQRLQQQQQQQKKKKCRGNRKIQRYRKQLYAQGLDSETVNKLIEEKLHNSEQPQRQQNHEAISSKTDTTQNLKSNIPLNRLTLPNLSSGSSIDSIEMTPQRKRFLLTPTPTVETRTILDKPLSHLSVSPTNKKKKKKTTTTLSNSSSNSSIDSIEMTPKRKRFLLTPTPTVETRTILDKPLNQLSISLRKKKKKKKKKTATRNVRLNNNNDDLSMNSSENYKPSYLKVSDRIFKQLLSNSIDNGHETISCLYTNEKLHFVRQMTEITNNLYFKELQRQLWLEYYNISIKDDNWTSKITNGYAHQHNTCRMYRPKKSLIEQRRTKIACQTQEIQNELQTYSLKLQEYSKQWQPSIDIAVLSNAINECVTSGQRRLKDEFNYKKEMLTCNSKDHQLIAKFYELKPNEEQIHLAKQIWQTTADELRTREQLEILRQRISLKRLPPKTDEIINQLLDDNHKTLLNPALNENQRASFASRCSKTIIQCKFNLMIVQIDEFETMIRQNHTTLTSLQDKFSKLNREQPQLYTSLLMDAIEERRQTMINRFIRMRQHQLKTFFDEAPAVDNSN
ncbi:unnamed protein product [Adineta steineri]|uniref:Uncharacterized protein n=1 Tax=Adineta steineri TaxID=433720 RepID=A0A819K1Z0_9BILA|nr:unnamed protein product [Adineta steineri]